MSLYINRTLAKDGYPSKFKINLPAHFEKFTHYKIELFRAFIPELVTYESTRNGKKYKVTTQPNYDTPLNHNDTTKFRMSGVDITQNKIYYTHYETNNFNPTFNDPQIKKIPFVETETGFKHAVEIPSSEIIDTSASLAHKMGTNYSNWKDPYVGEELVNPSIFNVVERHSFMSVDATYDTLDGNFRLTHPYDNMITLNRTINLIATTFINPDGMVNFVTDPIPFQGVELEFEFFDQTFYPLRISEILLIIKFN